MITYIKNKLLYLSCLCSLVLSSAYGVDDTVIVSGLAPNILSYDQQPAAYFSLQEQNKTASTIVVVLPDGLVERFTITAAGHFRLIAHGYIPDPDYSFLGVITIAERQQLVVFDRTGLQKIEWPELFTNTPQKLTCTPVIQTVKQGLRLVQPRAYSFQRLINNTDHKKSYLLLPQQNHMAVFSSDDLGKNWLPQTPLPVRMTHKSHVYAPISGHAGQAWTSQVQIASPTICDLNADGLLDVVTHQDEEWVFSINNGTEQPHIIRLDTNLFYEAADDTNDQGLIPTIPSRVVFDYGNVQGKKYCDLVINYGRKLWFFPGTEHGPQLQHPVRYLFDEAMDGFFLCDLDDDKRQDLVTVKFELPSIGSLVLGVLAPISININVHGYRSLGSEFEHQPTWKKSLTIRLPPLVMAKEKFKNFATDMEEVEKSLFTLSKPNENKVAIYRPQSHELTLHPLLPDANNDQASRMGKILNRQLFDIKDPVFDLGGMKLKLPELLNAMTTINTNVEETLAQHQLVSQKDITVGDIMLVNTPTFMKTFGLVVASTPTIPWFIEAVPLTTKQ